MVHFYSNNNYIVYGASHINYNIYPTELRLISYFMIQNLWFQNNALSVRTYNNIFLLSSHIFNNYAIYCAIFILTLTIGIPINTIET
jgi:hypothetical protein